MKAKDFSGLLQSIAEARDIARGRKLKGALVHVPKHIDVAAIREMTGFTQAEFSAHIGVSLATLRNWEQKRREPEGPARVLLALLAKDPGLVRRMLKPAA